jgi:hypothetical protein
VLLSDCSDLRCMDLDSCAIALLIDGMLSERVSLSGCSLAARSQHFPETGPSFRVRS